MRGDRTVLVLCNLQPSLMPTQQDLAQLFHENGVHLPLVRVGCCQYSLCGGRTFVVRVINGKAMVRSGPSFVDFVSLLEKQPVRLQPGTGASQSIIAA
jgi:hypothetical protein